MMKFFISFCLAILVLIGVILVLIGVMAIGLGFEFVIVSLESSIALGGIIVVLIIFIVMVLTWLIHRILIS